jgi:hypothetical protein
MTSIRSGIAAMTLVAGSLLVGGTAIATSASAATTSREPCPSGYACLYDGSAYSKYGSYGAHNLSGVTGSHFFFNAQTGGAKAYLCTGYNGTGTCTNVPAGTGTTKNFGPINSIYLSA